MQYHRPGCFRRDPTTALMNGRRSAKATVPKATVPNATVLAVANQKGGVAKTTTVASLGAAWSQLGQRVLIVDLDPQACLTFSVGYDPELMSCSVHQLLVDQVAAEDAVLSTEEGPDLLPATIELSLAEQLLAS